MTAKDICKVLNEIVDRHRVNVNAPAFRQYSGLSQLNGVIAFLRMLGIEIEAFAHDDWPKEYFALTYEGQEWIDKVADIQKRKIEAIREKQYEKAAHLRDEERRAYERLEPFVVRDLYEHEGPFYIVNEKRIVWSMFHEDPIHLDFQAALDTIPEF